MEVPTYQRIREMSEEDLIRCHDEIGENATVDPALLLSEITRREINRVTRKTVCITHVILYATVANLVFVALSAFGVL